MSEPQWKEVDWSNSDVALDWLDCTIGFDCICGRKGHVMSDDGDELTCDECGRSYRFTVSFATKEPPKC